ncbi:MAG: T9SS type A sorting domain-containing protein [Bacteroidia bacterium]|nr:T9SS type A sorting domain-containing protein [Bacteroidia bacterium]
MILLFLLVFWANGSRAMGQSSPAVCQERITFWMAGNPIQIPACYNLDPDKVHPEVNRVVILIHGTTRTATDQYVYISDAAQMVPGAADSCLLLVPQFLTEDDISGAGVGADFPFWDNGSRGWKTGYPSDSTAAHPRSLRVSSYALIDTLIQRVLANCPNLRTVVVAGHSGGGQFVNRYSCANPMEGLQTPGVAFRYVVANPSTYLYFTPERPVGRKGLDFAIPKPKIQEKCPHWDRYKFGISDFRGCSYVESQGGPALESRFPLREMVFLLGEKDKNPNDEDLDQTCQADLQGKNRLERGLSYFNYLIFHFGPSILSNHYLYRVPGTDHSARQMIQSDEGLEAIFGKKLSPTPSPPPLSTQIRIYPNPGDGSDLTLSMDPPFSGTVKIMDTWGRILLQLNLNGIPETHFTDLGLKPGIYLLVMENNETQFVKKLIIHR